MAAVVLSIIFLNTQKQKPSNKPKTMALFASEKNNTAMKTVDY